MKHVDLNTPVGPAASDVLVGPGKSLAELVAELVPRLKHGENVTFLAFGEWHLWYCHPITSTNLKVLCCSGHAKYAHLEQWSWTRAVTTAGSLYELPV